MSDSNSPSKPLIVVLGATGAQGGSVVRYLLDDPDRSFRIRALTRNVNSAKAKELDAAGVEVVKADLDDPESMKGVFEGAYGVFGVTNYWETMSEEVEIRQGKMLIDAALAANVQHFVWSTLDHTSDPAVAHWNSKATIDDYLKLSGVPRTSLYTSFYFENFVGFPTFMFKKTTEGKFVAEWPYLLTDGPVGGYSVGETGAYVLEALKKPTEWIGRDMRILSDIFTPRQFVETVREITGRDIELKETDRETFVGAKSGMEDIWSNTVRIDSEFPEWFYLHDGNPNRDPALTERIYPARKGMRAFVEANKEVFLSQLIV
ncbi:hypothetical protein M0805_006226 [Coniferiporia weirii]|nr:hypothetical protein M0805_006226 [Coniferiporia weirii]